jgi:hypothetical protein
MKQGQANTSGSASTKREPIAHAVNPAAVAEIGILESRTNSLPLYEGRGLEAPMQGTTNHPTGSQGKYK